MIRTIRRRSEERGLGPEKPRWPDPSVLSASTRFGCGERARPRALCSIGPQPSALALRRMSLVLRPRALERRQLQAVFVDAANDRERRQVDGGAPGIVYLWNQEGVGQRRFVALAVDAGRQVVGQERLDRPEPLFDPVLGPGLALEFRRVELALQILHHAQVVQRM